MSETFPEVEFIVSTARALVDNPDDVRADRITDDMGVLVTLFVNPSDMGKVIGREGSTAKALRTILRVVGMRHNARVNLKIHDPRPKNDPVSIPEELKDL